MSTSARAAGRLGRSIATTVAITAGVALLLVAGVATGSGSLVPSPVEMRPQGEEAYAIGEAPGKGSEEAGGEAEDLRGALQYWAARHRGVTAMSYLHANQHAAGLPHSRTVPAPGSPTPGGAATTGDNGSLALAAATPVRAWSGLGPQPINPGFGGVAVSGRATSVAVDPTNASVIYLGTANGGVWKSTNGGTSWSTTTDKQASLAIGAVAVDPANTSIVLAGTGEPNQSLDSYQGVGVLRSADAGATWTLVGQAAFGTLSSQISRVVFDPTDTSRVWAATTTGLYQSTDTGVTWAKVGALPSGIVDDVAVNSLGVALASVRGSGVWRLSGGTWSKLTLPAAASFTRRSLVQYAPSNGQTVYVLTTDSSNQGVAGLFYSNDTGGTWAQSVTSPTNADNAATNQKQGWYDLVLAVDPKDSHRVYVGAVDMVVATDAQSAAAFTWTNITHVYSSPASGVHPDQHGLAFPPGCAAAPCPFLLANDGGIWRSGVIEGAPTGTFSDLNSNLNTAEFTAGDIGPSWSSSPLLLGGTQDNGTLRYTGPALPGSPQAWPMQLGADGGPSAIDWRNQNVQYAQTQWAGLYKSTNGGSSFSYLTSLNQSLFYAPLAVSRTDGHLLWGGVNAVESIDGGATFYSGSQYLGNYVTAVAIDPSSSSTEYAGVYRGQLWRTTSGGNGAQSTWSRIDQGSFPNGYVSGIAVDPSDSNTVVVAISSYCKCQNELGSVWETTDGGTTWTDITGSLPTYPVNTVLTYRAGSSRVIVVGTDYGVAYTTNDGGYWTMLDTGLPNASVTSLSMDNSGAVVAFTHGRGAWLLPAAATPTVTSATAPPLLRASPFTVTFSRPVANVTSADFTVDEVGNLPVAGKVTCLNAANASVSCAKGPVTTARLTPSKALIAGEYYFIYVNKTAASVVDYVNGAAVPYSQTYVRAQTSLTAFDYPVTYAWPKISDAAALGKSYVRENTAGQTETFTASGSSVGIITWNGPDGGTATVTVTTPGQPTVTRSIDTYAATYGDVTTTIGSLPTGTHTVTISVDGTHSAASTGNWVRIDATVVGGAVKASPTLVASVWTNYPGIYAYTNSTGASVSLKFRGTGISWKALIGPNEGRAKVTIDGVVVAAAQDLYAPGFVYDQLFTYGGLSESGFHTVVITCLGTKQAAASDAYITLQGLTVQ